MTLRLSDYANERMKEFGDDEPSGYMFFRVKPTAFDQFREAVGRVEEVIGPQAVSDVKLVITGPDSIGAEIQAFFKRGMTKEERDLTLALGGETQGFHKVDSGKKNKHEYMLSIINNENGMELLKNLVGQVGGLFSEEPDVSVQMEYAVTNYESGAPGTAKKEFCSIPNQERGMGISAVKSANNDRFGSYEYSASI